MHEKDLSLLRLFDFYGGLLGDAAKEQFEMYYQNDLSLSEISELTGISRQGVRSNLTRAADQLRGYEKVMRLAEHAETADAAFERMRRLIIDGDKDGALALIEQIKDIL